MPNSHVATTYVKEVIHIYVLFISESKKFALFQSMTIRFWVTGHSEKIALNDPQMTLNTATWTRSKVLHVLLISTSPQFQSFLSYHQPFFWFELQTILRQVHWMTQNDLEHYEVKHTPYMC